jgi:hypothetical protein
MWPGHGQKPITTVIVGQLVGGRQLLDGNCRFTIIFSPKINKAKETQCNLSQLLPASNQNPTKVHIFTQKHTKLTLEPFPMKGRLHNFKIYIS